MHIRRASVDDAAHIAELNTVVHAIHAAGRADIFKPLMVDEAFIGLCRDRLTQPDCYTYIAELDGEPIGYLMAFIVSRPENPFAHSSERLIVDALSINPAYRSRGYGERLMQQAYALARAQGIKRVELAVWTFNTRAKTFYERLGFSVYQERMELVLEE
jgi:ribosomal protein S18 acetylase RimI-like enzyme